jgi:glyoxylase I family protein
MPTTGGTTMIFNGMLPTLFGALCGGLVVAAMAHGGSAPIGRVERTAVRYQVADPARSVEFYTHQLGFKVSLQNGPFASVTCGSLTLILSGPGTSGARPMPDGRKQTPGGWNRILLYVDNLDAEIARLQKAGVHFRNKVEVGPGGSQVLIDDPDGNPIELHEAPKP